jgi:uncharacterized protein (DUF362 family)
MSLVSFVKIEKYNTKRAITDALRLINYEFRDDVRKIVIKPNMCYYWDSSTGQTTDPKLVGALIDVIRDNVSSDPDISIVESDASAMKCKYVFRFLGYEKLAQNYDVRLVNLSEDTCDPVKVTSGGISFHLMMPRTIQCADLKINVPKIKYSLEKIKITCALKNVFGCNPYPKKFRYHSKLNEAIVAINKAMKFDLTVIDGDIVSGGQPRRLGLVMASTDQVAIDAAAARVAGVNPTTVKYVQLASKEGLGKTTFIQKGLSAGYFQARYPREGFYKKLMNKAYNTVVLMGLGKRLGLE